MPDILIRMEMPKTCADCHDADLPTAIAWLGAKCPWANGIIDPGVYDLRHDRHPNCPLQKLPEHGDLIDVGKAKDVKFQLDDDFPNDYQIGWNDAIDSLAESAPVIVPSNKEDAE